MIWSSACEDFKSKNVEGLLSPNYSFNAFIWVLALDNWFYSKKARKNPKNQEKTQNQRKNPKNHGFLLAKNRWFKPIGLNQLV